MPYTLTPVPFIGITPSGGMRIYTYDSGTTTPATAYADAAGATPFGAYVEADSDGLFPAIYLPQQAYKFSFYEQGITPPSPAFATADPVWAVPSSDDLGDVSGTAGEAVDSPQICYLSDGSGGKNAGQWYKTDSDFSYAGVYPVVGVPTGAIAMGATGTFRLIGRVTGFSGLVAGTKYFIARTAGEITTLTLGLQRGIGVADSTTSLVLTPGPSWLDLAVAYIQTSTLTGTQADFETTNAPVVLLRHNNAGGVVIPGFANGVSGRRIIICPILGTVELQNATGTAANQIYTGGGSLFTVVDRVTVLVYDGTSLKWRVESTTAAPGADTQVIFNDAGVLAGDSAFTFNKTTNDLTIGSAGSLTVALNVTAGGNVGATGHVSIGTNSPATPADMTRLYKDQIIHAWGSISNSGAPSIAADVNIASLTDNGVGDVTATFATALLSSNYAAVVSPVSTVVGKGAQVRSKSTGAVRFLTFTTGGETPADMDFDFYCVGG